MSGHFVRGDRVLMIDDSMADHEDGWRGRGLSQEAIVAGWTDGGALRGALLLYHANDPNHASGGLAQERQHHPDRVEPFGRGTWLGSLRRGDAVWVTEINGIVWTGRFDRWREDGFGAAIEAMVVPDEIRNGAALPITRSFLTVPRQEGSWGTGRFEAPDPVWARGRRG